jgi:hypothetical protein
MRGFAVPLASLLALAYPLATVPAPAAAPSTASMSHAQLVKLFVDWRAFNHPTIVRGRPDYGAAAMSEKAARLPSFRKRLAAIDRTGWSATQLGDYRLVEAEMNGLDFFPRPNRISTCTTSPTRSHQQTMPD